MTQFSFLPPQQQRNSAVTQQAKDAYFDANYPIAGQLDPAAGRFTTPVPEQHLSNPLYGNEPTTQSLIAALQSTLSPSTAERMVVIPGNSRRRRTEQLKPVGPVRRMRPQIRYGIIATAIFAIFLLTLFSLSPLSSGQNPFSPFLGGMSAADAQQQAGNVLSHDPPVAMTDANNTGTNTTTTAPMILPTSQYRAIARQDAVDAGINPNYFERQIYVESSFNPNAVSPYGAVGIAQFLPSTAAGLGIDPWNPIQALRGAAQLMARYAAQYNGNYAMALAAYNAGTGNVQNAVRNCGNNWMNCLPAETQSYIQKIIYG